MISVRKSEERGHFDHGWLDTRHTFSFAEYLDPRFMGFRDLRVINEDRVQPGEGFGTHGHRDMEIITYVLEGELAHRDSLGHGETLRPDEVQRMTAGTGIRHSEFNASETLPLHLLQIWILPGQTGLPPGYEQKAFPAAQRRGRLQLVAAPDGAGGALSIHQDVRVHAGLFAPGERDALALAPGRGAWLQVARGGVRVNGVELRAGDGAALEEEPTVQVEGVEDAEVLVFDLR
jgi:hypothetical protein